MSNYTKVAFRGSLTILILSLTGALLGYVVRVVLARNISMEDFGLFYSVLSFLGLIGMFKSLGFDKALVKFIPEFLHQKRYDHIKSSMAYAWSIQLITNTVIVLAVYLLSDFLAMYYFHEAKARMVLMLMAVAFAIDSFVLVLKFSFQGFKKTLYFAGIDVLRMLIIIGVILFGVQRGYGLLSPVYAYIAAPSILFVIFGILLRYQVFPQMASSELFFEWGLFKRIAKYGVLIMSIGLGSMVLGYTDMVMLTYMTSLSMVALYSVALPTAKVLMYFPRAIGGILLPLSSELWVSGKKKILREGMESIYKYSVMGIVPLALILFSFTDIIITILYGSQYTPAAAAMKILSLGMIFGVIHNANGNFFAGIGKPQITSKLMYLAAGFNIVLNLFLIPVIGIKGAAIATATGYFLMAMLGMRHMKKLISIRIPIKIWAKIVVSGMLFCLVVWSLKNTLALNIWVESFIVLLCACITYVVSLFALRVLTIAEVKDVLRRITG